MASIEKCNRETGTITLNLSAEELVTITNCFYFAKKEGKDTHKSKFYGLYKDLIVARDIASYGTINGSFDRITMCSKLMNSRKK